MKLWMARTKGGFKKGYLAVFSSKPSYIEHKDEWVGSSGRMYISNEKFPEVSFENSPTEVELKLINLDNSGVMNDDVQPEHSYIESVYRCGKKPHWNIGDTLAYYEFYSDREGEYVLGKVTKVKFDEEQCDWFYTFEDGSVYDEQSLLEDETYKKN